MADMQQIAAKLLERTKEEKVFWKPWTTPNAFAAVVGDLLVIVASQELRFEYMIKLSVQDSNGTEIDSIQGRQELDATDPDLIELHRVAKRSALGVDDKLNKLLDALESVS
jgi:hypothetical protein